MTGAAGTEIESWLASLGLPRHERLLRDLVAHATRDRRVRFIELACSVARGAGDELSDLDLGIGIDDNAWPSALDDLSVALRLLGEPIDVLEHEMTSWAGRPHRRYFIQFADLVQVDLVAMPASTRGGLPPGSIAIYDPDGRLASPMSPPQEHATPADVREWAFEAYVALMNMDKYLRRGSPWEALEQLHVGRTLTWQLWAVARGIPFPAFGLTAVLDADGAETPPGLQATVAGLSPDQLRFGGAALLPLVTDIARRACERIGAAHPDAMAAFVAGRWSSLGETGTSTDELSDRARSLRA